MRTVPAAVSPGNLGEQRLVGEVFDSRLSHISVPGRPGEIGEQRLVGEPVQPFEGQLPHTPVAVFPLWSK
jgi:hypothetical protein